MVRLLFVALLALSPWVARSQEAPLTPPVSKSSPMVFSLVQECRAANQECVSVIQARGSIEKETPQALVDFLRPQLEALPSAIYFDSTGGNVVSALQMGVLLRKLGLDTVVSNGAKCYSACVYAFLGGNMRTLKPEAMMGVHRFSLASGGQGNLDDSQRLTALLTEYIQGMGVSPVLLRGAAQAGANELVRVNQATAFELLVDNTNPPSQPWSLKPHEKGIDLLVAQHSIGNDRRVLVRVGMRNGEGVVGVIFQEPAIYSEIKLASEIAKTPFVVICRLGSTLDVDRSRCLRGDTSIGWKQEAKGRYAIAFNIQMKEMLRLVEGNPDDAILLTVGTDKANQPMLFLRTLPEGFSRALKAVTSE